MKAPVSIAVAVLAMGLLAWGATDQGPRDDDSIARLQDRISSLEHRVEALENRLRATTAGRSSAVRRPVPTPRSPNRPRGWRRKEFNGRSYYVIPLEQEPAGSSQRSR